MYLRETKRRNADGSVVRYYQLAENTWDRTRGCAVAKVVYSFGRADSLDRETLRRLAASILRVCEDDATRGAALRSADGTSVPDGVVLRDARPFGGVYVLGAIWAELGIGRILAEQCKRAGTTQPFERAIFAMVANRALSPYSKLYCWEQWLREEVYLPSASALQLHHLYRAMDFLEEHREEVEKAVYFATSDLLNADVDLIFYDTTSLHFENDAEDADVLDSEGGVAQRGLRKRGYSKNGRSDAPQIVVGLAVTRDGRKCSPGPVLTGTVRAGRRRGRSAELPGHDGLADVGSPDGLGEIVRRVHVVQLRGLDQRVEDRRRLGASP